MSRHAYIGLDLGSSSIKAVALDEAGQGVGSAKRPNPIRTGPGGIAEQDPQTWHDLAGETLRELTTALAGQSLEPAAIATTGQMNGPVLLDGLGKATCPVQMWCDSRCAPQCRTLERRIEAPRLLWMTGHTAVTGYTAPKLLWIDEHLPDQLNAATQLIFPKDFLTRALTGQTLTDYSDASNSLLLNIHRGEWDESILHSLELTLPELPALAESAEVVGGVSREGAAWSGLRQGIPVAAGAGDSISAALGAGLRDPSMIQVVVGSAGNVNCVLDEAIVDDQGRVHTGYFTDRRHWICSAVQQSAGASLQWWSGLTGIDPAVLVEEIDLRGPSTTQFAPYLCGERTPHLDPDVRGAFVNLNQHSSRADLTRAILEGVAFSFRDAFEVFQEMDLSPHRAAISGGGGESGVWRRIIAGVLDLPLIAGTGDTTARGAAMLAACASGRFESWSEAIDGWSQPTDEVQAEGELAERYQTAYQQFRELYPRLRSLTRKL